MTELAKVTLQALKEVKAATKKEPATVKRDGPPIEVQLNPSSLRLERRNNVDKGGVSTGAQRRQHPSAEPLTLGFDLEFDTADEVGAAPNSAVDVRAKTLLVRRFVEPPPDKPKDPPPRVEFRWGTLILQGLMTQVVEELDYFAADGTPLHAKLTVSITEQNLAFEKNALGSGARDAKPAAAARERNGPGTSGTGLVTALHEAQDGESAQQLAARIGGNPAAWRSVMNGLESPLLLAAGTEVEVGPALDSAGAIGTTSGFAAERSPTEPAVLAQVLGSQPDPGAPAELTLAAAGGVQAATTRVLAAATSASASSARSAFTVPAAGPRPQEAASVDPRACSYGTSVPLAARADLPTLARIEAGGTLSVAARARPAEVPVARGPARPPWEQLPGDDQRARADAEQRRRDARPSTIRARPGGECA